MNFFREKRKVHQENSTIKEVKNNTQSENISLKQVYNDYTRTYCGYADDTGKKVIPCIYREGHEFSEGLAAVARYTPYLTWGFIDKTGKEVIPCIYDSADSFKGGCAIVSVNGKSGYIDKTGKEIIQCIYDNLTHIDEDAYQVSIDGKYGVISVTGEVLIPIIYDYLSSSLKGMLVKKDGKWGYISKERVIIPIIYDYIYVSDAIQVQRDGYWYYLNNEGNEIGNTKSKSHYCEYDNCLDYNDGPRCGICNRKKYDD